MTANHGSRFAFGENWLRYVEGITGEHVAAAEQGLYSTLCGISNLAGAAFLDAGCGSGIVSLAAVKAGATLVCGFDFDAHSVAASRILKQRYAPDANWTIEQGSLLDHGYMRSLPLFDIVYCWGVAHHTGRMWDAIGLLAERVTDGGMLALALYNDQGLLSGFWKLEKRIVAGSPQAVQRVVAGGYLVAATIAGAARDILSGRSPLRRFRGTHRRGMSRWRDAIDWVGGYPFEVAKRDDVIVRTHALGFELLNVDSVGSRSGCNEFLFKRSTRP